MARKATSAAIAAVPTPAPKAAPMHGPREENPRRRRRGRKGHRKGRRRNPKKNLGYGAKVGIAIGALVVVGGGGYMIYRHYKNAAGCPAGMQPNPEIASTRASLLATGLTSDVVELTIAKMPKCVPV